MFYGLPCAGITSTLLAFEAAQKIKFNMKLFLFAGDIFYSLYLTHIIVIAAYGKIVMKLSLFNYINGYLLFVLDFILAFMSASIIYLAVERPLHNITKQVRYY